MSSAWACIEHRGEILLVRRSFDRGRGGQWCLPGGTIWPEERPDVACVREAFEETGLRVSIRRKIAVFQDAHYYLCHLNTRRTHLNLRLQECIDSHWVFPDHVLDLGDIMDLRRLIPLLNCLGFSPPTRLPKGLRLAVPEQIF